MKKRGLRVFSPQKKIKILLEGLQPNMVNITIKKWKIYPPYFYIWLRKAIIGAKIHLDDDYLNCRNTAVVNFKRKLLKPLEEKLSELEKENNYLKSKVVLLKPVKKMRYKNEERIEIVNKIK